MLLGRVECGTDGRLHGTLADKLFSTYRNILNRAKATSAHRTPRRESCLQCYTVLGPVAAAAEGGTPPAHAWLTTQ